MGRLVYFLKVYALGDLWEEEEVKREFYSIKYLSRNLNSEKAFRVYQEYITDLNKMIVLSEEKGVPLIVLIFPYVFQIGDKDLQLIQRRLSEYLKARNIQYIDFTEVWEKKIAGSDGLLEKVFLDQDHYTVKGHRLVSDEIFNLLVKKNLI
jgi:hypothetical protein